MMFKLGSLNFKSSLAPMKMASDIDQQKGKITDSHAVTRHEKNA